MAEARPDWYDGFFEDDWLDEIARTIDDERTRREVDFAVERLELAPGARVLDVGCGHGRHSLELARRGFGVVGVDLRARPRRSKAATPLSSGSTRAASRSIPSSTPRSTSSRASSATSTTSRTTS